MTPTNDLEAFFNTFENTSTSAGWSEDQWAVVPVPCLIGSAQQMVNTLPTADLADYQRVKVAILQTLNLNLEAYCRRLFDIRP